MGGEFLFLLVFFQIQVPAVLGSTAAVMFPLCDFHYSSEESWVYFYLFINIIYMLLQLLNMRIWFLKRISQVYYILRRKRRYVYKLRY